MHQHTHASKDLYHCITPSFLLQALGGLYQLDFPYGQKAWKDKVLGCLRGIIAKVKNVIILLFKGGEPAMPIILINITRCPLLRHVENRPKVSGRLHVHEKYWLGMLGLAIFYDLRTVSMATK